MPSPQEQNERRAVSPCWIEDTFIHVKYYGVYVCTQDSCDVVGLRITGLRRTQKWGLAVVQATNMSSIHEAFTVSPYIKREVPFRA